MVRRSQGPVASDQVSTAAPPASFWTRSRTVPAVVFLLAVHGTLAVLSLVRENPTVDEVIHLPAGISYWQTGKFRLYHHNPPLVKLVAAWPVLRAGVVTAPLYQSSYWRDEPPNKAGFAHEFARLNAPDYFELFTRARLVMPLFSLVGALAVFFWSRALYGNGGGLLSLSLWSFCPNVLAHARLITTDVTATSFGVLATYTFWLYLRRPSWSRATSAGVCLGLAQLTKFSLLLLYGVWPLLWLLHELLTAEPSGRGRRIGRALGQGAWVVLLSLLVIDMGYGWEGVGRRLGDFNFVSAALSRPRARPIFFQPRPDGNHLEDRIREYRVNRFRGTFLDKLPAPLPSEYLLGFDAQKLEADGVPVRFLAPPEVGDAMGPEGDRLQGYPVYLDGELSDRSWGDYYLRALAYKVPEGTWVLFLLSWFVLTTMKRPRAAWFDEVALLVVPVVVLVVMSAFTNINLGLRYVLPIFPYLFISAGKLAPWARGRVAVGVVALSLTATAVSTLAIHPHYLAYFNLISGGPSQGSAHLIDSNLDWGQDLVNLKRWADRNAPGEPIGLAYFGQINPNLFEERGTPLNWFLPPPLPGTMPVLPPGTAHPPRPGLYAVSASLVRGLPWRVYDPSRWAPWSADRGAFSYFQQLTPVAPARTLGYSILLYRITEEDAKRLEPLWTEARPR